eukprot:gene8515-14514_t
MAAHDRHKSVGGKAIMVHSILNQIPSGGRTSQWNTAHPVEEIWMGETEKLTSTGVSETLSTLKSEIFELQKIKVAALNDLRDLEGKRYLYQDAVKKLAASKLDLLNEIKRSERGLNKLKNELRALQSAVESKKYHVNIPVGKPKQLRPSGDIIEHNKQSLSQSKCNCKFSSCFDYSQCSLLEPFSVYVYKPSPMLKLPVDYKRMMDVYQDVLKFSHVTTNPKQACIFVDIVILDVETSMKYEKGVLLRHFSSLSRWESDGRNHLIMFLSKQPEDESCKYVAEMANTKSIIASSIYCKESFREQFDVLLYPDDLIFVQGHGQSMLPKLFPIRRKYLFTFVEKSYGPIVSNSDLIALRGNYVNIYIKAGCKRKESGLLEEFTALCQDAEDIERVLQQSTFNIIYTAIKSQDQGYFLRDIITSLVNGAIPVVIGKSFVLPFSEFIDYRKFIIFITGARVPETHYILRMVTKSNVFGMRKHGRFIYETYFASLKMNLMTIFSSIQSKAGLPPLPLEDYKSIPLFTNSSPLSFKNERESSIIMSSPYDSNWTTTNVNSHDLWNNYPGAHYLLKFVPRNTVLPPSVQFFEDVTDYMPIGNGEGGDGKAFKNSLGGDSSVEHFTVVILTYDRELILVESLQRLSNLKYLNRVIVIWNNPIMPSKELEWPEIGVPIHVVKGEKNSLNNRFLPFDLIDTEAVLSMDDDIYLRDDEIELAFRIWRENRDRIVGFPGRFHSWNPQGGWSYNANHSCELSMVLTGGAFFHKYYSYLYTYLMPETIRDMVDEYMNCEDIAMNFLVAHVTGRPPVKVTSRWTFRCPGCPSSLSNDNTHYTERAKCLQLLRNIYGYMPLRRTQFRADSVLFKTRLAATEKKCYQFV